MNQLVRFFSSNSVAALLSKVSSAFFSFVFVWAVARLLSTSDAGVFLYTYTLMMILVQLARAGTEHSLVKNLSGDITSLGADIIVSKIVLYVELIAVVLIAIIIGLIHGNVIEMYTIEENTLTLYYFLATVAAFSMSQVLGSYFQTRYEVYSQYWAMNVGVVMISSILVAVLIAQGEGVSSLMLSKLFFAVNVFVLIWCILLYLKSSSRLPKAEKSLPKSETNFISLVKFTLPFSILAFITIIVQWGGQLLASLWLDEEALGVLSVCVRLAILVSFVFTAFNALLAPKISALYKNGSKDEIYKSTLFHTAISLVYALIVTIAFAVGGESFLGLFGDDYVVGYESLLILSIGWLIKVFIGPVDIILLMTGKVKDCRRNLYVSAIVSVCTASILIPLVGMIGAVISMSVSGVLLSILNSISVIKHYDINYISLTGLTDKITILNEKIMLKLKVKIKL